MLEIRYAMTTARLELTRLRIARSRKRYDPNQPRVPAGNADGGQWSGEGGRGGGGSPRSQYAQLRPRPIPGGNRIIGGRVQTVTPAQEARLDVTAAQARALVREVQRRDPSWKPRSSIYEGAEGQILANQADAQQAAARLRELGGREPILRPMQDAILPNGQPIGTRNARARSDVRTVTRQEFRELLESVSPDAQSIPSPPGYRGHWYQRPDGSVFGVRRSEQNGMTFDVIRNDHQQIGRGYKVHKK